MGIVDPERIGIMGHSQGGYAVLALLVQSSRFKWAITADGWSDYTSYYGILRSDGTGYEFGQAERQLGGAPWEVPLRYVANSPIYFLDKINTPLLIVHGSDDPDHPVYLADQLFVGLRRLKKNVEYAKYDGESHAPRDWSYKNQIDLVKRVLDWMARYTPEEGSVVSTTSH